QLVGGVRVGRGRRHGDHVGLRERVLPGHRLRRVLRGRHAALGLVRHTVGLASMRAAYAALILGILSGLVVETGVLSGHGHTQARDIASVLALRRPGEGLNRRHAEAVTALVAQCMAGLGLTWTPWVEPTPTVPDAELDPAAWAARGGVGGATTGGRAA